MDWGLALGRRRRLRAVLPTGFRCAAIVGLPDRWQAHVDALGSGRQSVSQMPIAESGQAAIGLARRFPASAGSAPKIAVRHREAQTPAVAGVGAMRACRVVPGRAEGPPSALPATNLWGRAPWLSAVIGVMKQILKMAKAFPGACKLPRAENPHYARLIYAYLVDGELQGVPCAHVTCPGAGGWRALAKRGNIGIIHFDNRGLWQFDPPHLQAGFYIRRPVFSIRCKSSVLGCRRLAGHHKA